MVGRSAYYDKCISAPEEAKLGFVRRSRATRSWNPAQEGVVVIQLFVTRILKKSLTPCSKQRKHGSQSNGRAPPNPNFSASGWELFSGPSPKRTATGSYPCPSCSTPRARQTANQSRVALPCSKKAARRKGPSSTANCAAFPYVAGASFHWFSLQLLQSQTVLNLLRYPRFYTFSVALVPHKSHLPEEPANMRGGYRSTVERLDRPSAYYQARVSRSRSSQTRDCKFPSRIKGSPDSHRTTSAGGMTAPARIEMGMRRWLIRRQRRSPKRTL